MLIGIGTNKLIPSHTLYYTDLLSRADLRQKIEFDIEKEVEGDIIPPDIVDEQGIPVRTEDGKLIRVIGGQLFNVHDEPLIANSNYLPVFFRNDKYYDWNDNELFVLDYILVGVISIENFFQDGNTAIAFGKDGVTRIPIIIDDSVYPAKLLLLNGKDATPYIEDTTYLGDEDWLRQFEFSGWLGKFGTVLGLLLGVIGIILLVVLIVILFPYIAPIFTIIMLPFKMFVKGIKSIFNSFKKKKNNGGGQ
jgi:hypothetical protein